MQANFPKLPGYVFSWRNVFVEPIPFSGERFSVGMIVKGDDQSLVVAKILPSSKLREIFGDQLGERLIDAVNLCLSESENFYKINQISKHWIPPLDGFHVGEERSSVADSLEVALHKAALFSSSYAVAVEFEKKQIDIKGSSTPDLWRKSIFQEVVKLNSALASSFEKKIFLKSASNSPLAVKYGFLSAGYAAHFDALASLSALQSSLMRVQSKLWQLDLLRDYNQLFKPQVCELVFQVPLTSDTNHVNEFIDELKYEASRKEIGLFATHSSTEAAHRVVEMASRAA